MLSGVSFYSLQQEWPEKDGNSSPFHLQPLARRTRNILDAAAAMLQLDLIITVDTLTAHLAGALGCPVWLLLQHEADWRWQREGRLSPWYATMQIFRQTPAG